MKFSRVISLAALFAASFGFIACDDSSSASSDEKAGYDCSVKGGVKVVYPAGGEKFKMGETITVIYGSDIQGTGFRFVYKVDKDDLGDDMFEESMGPEHPDGKTCYEQKVVLDSNYSEPSDEAIIRVIPYENSSKAGNSGTFKVSK